MLGCSRGPSGRSAGWQADCRGSLLEWTPRDHNAEADALADGRVDGFNPAHRIGGRAGDLPWRVLPDLLRTGEAFYAASKKRPRPAAEPVKGRRLAGDRLKDREPW